MNQEMPNLLKQRAELTPKRLAIKANNEEVTFEQLYKRVQQRATILSKHGIRENQHIAILMRNSVEMIETIHAVIALGAVAVMLNVRLSEQELAWQIDDVEAEYIICNREFQKNVKVYKTIVCEDLFIHHVEEILPSLSQVSFYHDKVATIMYTSGTTGNPKGVMQTYGNHWSSAISSALNLGLQVNDRWLLSVPLFHISGLSILMRSVIYGIGVVLHERFDAAKMNQAIMRDGVTIVSVVTTMLKQMIEQLEKERYPESFRCMLVGGGPVPEKYLLECQEKGIPVYQSYGMTETASQVVTLTPEDSLVKIGSAGKPLFLNQIKIMKNGQECQPNEEGEIFVKGPTITKGYWKKEEATDKAIKNGWLQTGDQGYVDEDGFLYVLDRRSDLIISGGENVYPAQIESVLLTHPNISDAGVIGVNDEKWGQSPHAFVVLKESVEIDEIRAFCQEKLAAYKVPKYYTIVDELPRNASNKLLRRKLKDLIKDNHDVEN
ncbi:o-succinylbenzoate--CoA ligase [Metabacillus sp. 22489]|uniref:o-succinylbenzoate--CoA ligase n=1 Tax=Metabacillus sp. 22489 TaxID=3453928 RepID=UPI003F82C0EB